MRFLAGFLMLAAASAQPPAEATIAIGALMADRFGVLVNTEDPFRRPPSDTKDITAEVSRSPNPTHRVVVPRGAAIAVVFQLKPDGKPADVPRMLQDLADAANRKLPYAYKVRSDGDTFAIVPTRAQANSGRVEPAEPLLDRKVTIPEGVRAIHESAQLMTNALSAGTGSTVTCCQTGVAGVPWGLTKIAFAAQDESARRVLRRLIRAEYPNMVWRQRCDPDGSWCVIQVRALVQPEPNPLR